MKNLIEEVKKQGDYKSNVAAKAAILATTNAIQALANKGTDVSIIGFGSFKTSIRKGKTGTIPGSKKTYTTQDKQVVKFSVGKQLAEAALGN